MVNEMVGVVLFHLLIREIYPLHDHVCNASVTMYLCNLQ